jgi:hypothetical protein
VDVLTSPLWRNAVNVLQTPAPVAVAAALPRDRRRTIALLVGGYAALSALAVAVAEVVHGKQASATRTHAIIVLASALLACRFTARALAGSHRALLRLRIVTLVVPVAIAVVIAIPGDFPLWMKFEQGVGFVLLAAVAVLLRGA